MSYIDTLKQQCERALASIKSSPSEALKIVLRDMPVREKKVTGDIKPKTDEEKRIVQNLFKDAKDEAAKNVLSVLLQIEKAKMKKAISELTNDERDILMKFVYRGFGEKDLDYQYLLIIHEEICENSGLGPVIRSVHTRLEV